MSHDVVSTVAATVALLLVASVAAIGFKRTRLPYSVGLVLVGLGLGALVDRVTLLEPLSLELSPEIILFIFLPTLIFESAFNLNSRLLSQNLVPVFALAAPGLLLSTAMIGGLVAIVTPLGLGPALLFGALISATDPVAVIALFKEVGAPKRLAILVEGESLFNDATAIVLFHIILGATVGGVVGISTVSDGVIDFFRVFVGGLVVGASIGYVMVRSIAVAEDDPLVEVALSTVVAYAAFLAAEHYLHVSGVMATVGAGVVVGTLGSIRFSPQVRAYLHQFWEFAAFVANSMIFLLVGLSVRLDGLVTYSVPIVATIVVVMVARTVVVFGLLPSVSRLPGAEPIDWRFRSVLFWGGLRGAVALALSLSLAPDFAQRDLIIALAVGVVLFTLLAGGITMGPLIRVLGLDRPTLVERMARAQAAAAAKREAMARVSNMAVAGHFSDRLVGDLEREYRAASVRVDEELAALRAECHTHDVKGALWAEALTVERSSYRDQFRRGFISEPVLRELELVVDLQRDQLNRGQLPESTPMAAPLEVRFTDWAVRWVERVAPRNRMVQRHRLRALAAKYEHDAATLAACRHVNDAIDRLVDLSGGEKDLVSELAHMYERRGQEAMSSIDSITEHFPEYVAAVQQQTARRIALDGEADAVQRLASAGAIPDSVAREARRAVDDAQRVLSRQPVRALAPRPDDLLVRVPFFANLESGAFDRVVAALLPRTVLAGRPIIRQGERGSSLFVLARGVVAVLVRSGVSAPRRVASLHAGDFFGEMALLTDGPRSATVQAISDCQLYELSRRDVEALYGVCPGLQETLIDALETRRRSTAAHIHDSGVTRSGENAPERHRS